MDSRLTRDQAMYMPHDADFYLKIYDPQQRGMAGMAHFVGSDMQQGMGIFSNIFR